jgi:hypothetical protein
MYYRIGTLRFDFVRRAEGMRPTMFAAMNSLTNALVTEDTLPFEKAFPLLL